MTRSEIHTVLHADRPINADNYHDKTFCNWTPLNMRRRPQTDLEKELRALVSQPPMFISRSGSEYWWTPTHCVRRSNHWLTHIKSCCWLLDGKETMQPRTAYASWSDFISRYPNCYEIGREYFIVVVKSDGRYGEKSIQYFRSRLLKITEHSKYFECGRFYHENVIVMREVPEGV